MTAVNNCDILVFYKLSTNVNYKVVIVSIIYEDDLCKYMVKTYMHVCVCVCVCVCVLAIPVEILWNIFIIVAEI